MAGVRRHWRLAKWLSPSLKAHHYLAWFAAHPGGMPADCLLAQLRWLIFMRKKFYLQHNSLAALEISAAIWKLVANIKNIPIDRAKKIPKKAK